MTAQRRERILIVDDEQPIVEILREHFQDRYEIDEAANGAAAIKRIKAHEPDLVLLDINMPGMSGTQALKIIREIDPTLPVIMLSANTDNDVTTDVIQSGALSYAPKPVNFPYLDHLVSIALDQRRGAP